jgi:hypothetical protein
MPDVLYGEPHGDLPGNDSQICVGQHPGGGEHGVQLHLVGVIRREHRVDGDLGLHHDKRGLAMKGGENAGLHRGVGEMLAL